MHLDVHANTCKCMQIQIRLSWKWFHMHRRIPAPPKCAISSPPPLCTCSGCSCPPANKNGIILNICLIHALRFSSCLPGNKSVVFVLFLFSLFVNLLSSWKQSNLQIIQHFLFRSKIVFFHTLNCFQSPCLAFWIHVKTSERWIIGNAHRMSVSWFRIGQVSIWRLSTSRLNWLFASHLSVDTIDSLNWLLIKSNNCK